MPFEITWFFPLQNDAFYIVKKILQHQGSFSKLVFGWGSIDILDAIISLHISNLNLGFDWGCIRIFCGLGIIQEWGSNNANTENVI